MAPIKIKLSLSSASLPSQKPELSTTASGKLGESSNTPRKGSKAPQHARTGLPIQHATPEAGPSRLQGASPVPTTFTPASRPDVESSDPIVATPTASTPSKSQRPTPKTASAKAKGKTKAKTKLAKQAKKPTAIPPRLLTSTPSTPKPAVPLPLHETPSPGGSTEVKQEDVEMVSSTPHTGSPSVEPENMGTADGEGGEDDGTGTPTTAQKQSVRWMRIKRPLREHATKIVADLVKRDEYDLFGEPVDLEAYPDYQAIVGGEDKMMDLGTMQTKIDNDEYRSMDEFQADLEIIATAAKTFNPVGTIPHNAAIRMYNQGVKQIDRIRDLVLTPHPSRAGSATNWRDGSVLSGRELTAALDDAQVRSAKADLPPASYIPEEMLAYPPHSGAAKMVGWNRNGGKRVYLKKITRGRERFTGKWRLWGLDGSRDVAEMEDPEMYFEYCKTRSGKKQRSIVDWQALRQERWWEFEGLGGPTGQPPLPGAAVPRRPITVERPLAAADWGVYPDIDNEMAAIGKRIGISDETITLYSHLNAPRIKSGPSAPPNFVNLFEEPQNRQPIDYMREFTTGDVTGEAYTRSIDRFIQGAIAGRTKSEEVKPDVDSTGLDEYVHENYGYGVLSKDFEQRGRIRRTMKDLMEAGDRKRDSSAMDTDSATELMQLAQSAYARTALRHLTKDSNALDIVPLIRVPTEFTWQGIGGKGDIEIGLQWVSEYQHRANHEIKLQKKRERDNPTFYNTQNKKPRLDDVASAASSPLSAPPGSPVKEATAPAPAVMKPTDFHYCIDEKDGENGLKRIRLELLALTKFYPLAALRKMDKATAERLLPPNVRALMTSTRR